MIAKIMERSYVYLRLLYPGLHFRFVNKQVIIILVNMVSFVGKSLIIILGTDEIPDIVQ